MLPPVAQSFAVLSAFYELYLAFLSAPAYTHVVTGVLWVVGHWSADRRDTTSNLVSVGWQFLQCQRWESHGMLAKTGVKPNPNSLDFGLTARLDFYLSTIPFDCG